MDEPCTHQACQGIALGGYDSELLWCTECGAIASQACGGYDDSLVQFIDRSNYMPSTERWTRPGNRDDLSRIWDFCRDDWCAG